MVNSEVGVNEEMDQRHFSQALEGILAEVPAIGSLRRREKVKRGHQILDATLEVVFESGTSQRWIIETKVAPLEPKVAEFVALRLSALVAQGIGDYAVVLARFVSPRSAEILDRRGIGYCDLSGNCRLVFGALFIERTGRPNPFARKATLGSLFTPGVGRVLRALLDARHQERSWTVRELAEAAYPGVSVGQAHKVATRLAEQTFLRRTDGGWRLADGGKLLAEWAAGYRFERSQATRYYCPLEPEVWKSRFVELAATPGTQGPRGLFASFTAAEILAPHVRQHRLFAYWRGERARLEKMLALKPVGSGENVVILEPYDEGVLYPAGVTPAPVTCPVQTYLDLAASPARGEEAAQAVFDAYLKRAYRR